MGIWYHSDISMYTQIAIISGVSIIFALISSSFSGEISLLRPVYGIGSYEPVLRYLFHTRLIVLPLKPNHFFICSTGSLRCLAAIILSRLSVDIGFTIITTPFYDYSISHVTE